MIRLATWIIVSLLVTAGIAWLVSLPGTATIEVAGYRMQPRLGMAAFVVVAMSQFCCALSVVPVLPTIGTPSRGLPAVPVPDFITAASAYATVLAMFGSIA